MSTDTSTSQRTPSSHTHLREDQVLKARDDYSAIAAVINLDPKHKSGFLGSDTPPKRVRLVNIFGEELCDLDLMPETGTYGALFTAGDTSTGERTYTLWSYGTLATLHDLAWHRASWQPSDNASRLSLEPVFTKAGYWRGATRDMTNADVANELDALAGSIERNPAHNLERAIDQLTMPAVRQASTVAVRLHSGSLRDVASGFVTTHDTKRASLVNVLRTAAQDLR